MYIPKKNFVLVFNWRVFIMACLVACWFPVPGQAAGNSVCLGQDNDCFTLHAPLDPHKGKYAHSDIVFSRNSKSNTGPRGPLEIPIFVTLGLNHAFQEYRFNRLDQVCAGLHLRLVMFFFRSNYYSDWYFPKFDHSPFIASSTSMLVPFCAQRKQRLSELPELAHPLTQEYVASLVDQPGELLHKQVTFGCESYDGGLLLDADTGISPLQRLLDSPDSDHLNLLVLLSEYKGPIKLYSPLLIEGEHKSVTLVGIDSQFPTKFADNGSADLFRISGYGEPVHPFDEVQDEDINDSVFPKDNLDVRNLTTLIASDSLWNGRSVIECRDWATCNIFNVHFQQALRSGSLPAAFVSASESLGAVVNSFFDSGGKFLHAKGDGSSLWYYRNIFKCDVESTLVENVRLVARSPVLCNLKGGRHCAVSLPLDQKTLDCREAYVQSTITPPALCELTTRVHHIEPPTTAKPESPRVTAAWTEAAGYSPVTVEQTESAGSSRGVTGGAELVRTSPGVIIGTITGLLLMHGIGM